jgi:CHAT domain-containing protein/Tfp pilus assembly protein PilF
MHKERISSRPGLCLFLALIVFICLNIKLNGQYFLEPEFILQINQLKKESRYDEAISMLDAHVSLVDRKNEDEKAVEAELLKADLYRMKGLHNYSIALTDSILKSRSATIILHEELMAQSYMIHATNYLILGELFNGKKAIQKAIHIFSAKFGENDTVLGPCYNKLGNYYFFTKMYDSALACYNLALSLATMKKNNLEDRASYIQNIGIIYLENGEFDKAEGCFLESLKAKESIYPSSSFTLGRVYLNIGKFYQNISDLDKALYFIEKAEQIYSFPANVKSFELGSTYWNKGLIYYLLGDYDIAITYLFNARQIIEEVFTDNRQMISSLNADIGNVYKSSGDYRRAIKYINLSLEDGHPDQNIKTHRNLANLYYLEGDYKKAEAHYKKLISDSKDPRLKNSFENAMTFLHYGDFLMEIQADSAIYYLMDAFDILSKNKGFHTRDIAATLYSIGNYYFKKKMYQEALDYNQQGLISVSNNFTEANILVNPDKHSLNPDNLVINILSNKALYLFQFYKESGNIAFLMASSNTYLLCMDIIEQLRIRYRTEYSQLLLSNEIHKIYHDALGQFLLTFSQTGDKKWQLHAFETSERGKSMILLNEFKDANAKKIGIIPENVSNAEKEIKKYLYLFRNQIWEEDNQIEPDTRKLNYLRSNLLKYEQKYDSLLNQLEKKYPGYFKLKYDNTIVSWRNLQKALDDDEVVIEYTLSDELLYIILVTAEDFEIKEVSIDSTVIADVFSLRSNLDYKHITEYGYNDFLQFQHASSRLYSKLISPVEAYLEGKKLIIIPDGELNYLSFESLIQNMSMADSVDFKGLPYLIRKCPVSYAASCTILSLIKKGPDPSLTSGVLALAPSFNMLTRNIFANNAALAPFLTSKMDLPGAIWEAETILKIMKGKKLIGDEATEAEFKKLASSFDILHFATHTRIDDDNPLSSTLSFYPYDGSSEDGVLHTYEIYSLDLKGEMAVLSACSTGNGKLQKGEGVISLARAFTYAGMPSVVMTLWDVDDISSGNIIPSFYQLLGEGYDKDAALRLSKLRYLEQTKPKIETHPAFWSGIVLYGNNRGFRQSVNDKYFISLAVLAGLIIFVAIILIKKITDFKNKLKPLHIDPPIEFRSEDRL